MTIEEAALAAAEPRRADGRRLRGGERRPCGPWPKQRLAGGGPALRSRALE